jgi:transcriptional regulator
MSVHVKGKIHFLDEKGLIDILRKTTLHFENNNAASSTVFDNLPPEYTTRLMKAIVAFEVEIDEIDHVFKISQNQDKESYQSIINELKSQDASASAIADEMEKRKQILFNK